MNIDHIAIWTNDLELEKDFYLKYFGGRAGNKYENKQKIFSSYFITFLNGSRMELMNQPNITGKFNPDTFGLAHIAMNVGSREKVDNLTQILEKDGYTIIGYPRNTGDGYYESVVLDPENNVVEITAVNDYKISVATSGDLEQILYLQKCCYLLEAEIYNDYTIPPITQKMEDIQHDFEKQTILKLEYNHKIIGSVRGFENDGTCFIGKLIVDKEYQNKGLGKLLLEAIENKFPDAKRYELFTGYKSDKNLYLYRKLGYRDFKMEIKGGISIVFLEKLVNI